jgi:hypothetical protein
MPDAVADSDRPTRGYWVRFLVADKEQLGQWTHFGIPNFLRVAYRKGCRTINSCPDLWIHKPINDSSLREVLSRMAVCRFAGIHSEQLDGSRGFIHVATYLLADSQPPQSVLWDSSEWLKWLRDNDTAGDILNPRVDSQAE